MIRWIAMLTLALGLPACKKETPAPLPEGAPETQAAVPAGPVITKAEFDKILYDMTLPQVIDIVGADPSAARSDYKEAQEYTGPVLTVWQKWENSGESFAEIGFISDKVAEKVEVKLP